MSKLIGRIERLEERAPSFIDVAQDAEHVRSAMHALAERLDNAGAQSSGDSRALQAAWRMRFLGESLDAAVAAVLP